MTEIANAINANKNASLKEINPPLLTLYFFNNITKITILIATLTSKSSIGIKIPIGLISNTYITRKVTIETAPIMSPLFNAELKSVFFVSIMFFVLLVWVSAKV
jgi:hypothetical protein